MSALNPTLTGAVAKAERGIAFLRLPGATSDHLRQAMDCFKSAGKLAASHHTVLVELEDQVPEPGPALFDSTGAPAPGVVAQPDAITSDEAILQVTGAAYEALEFGEQNLAEEDLMFAARVHFRSRGIPVETWHEFATGFQRMGWDAYTWEWLVRQVRDVGDFQWPHCCTGCQKMLPRPEEEEPDPPECFQCQHTREMEARRQAPKKSSTKKGKKAAPATEEGGGE
jgi:hypothetical protein